MLGFGHDLPHRAPTVRLRFPLRAADRLQPRAAGRGPGAGGRHRPGLAGRACDPDPGAQAARCLEIILAALAEAGAGPGQVVRTRMYLVDPADWEAVGRAHGEVFTEVRPVATMVVVAGLLDPRWRVEIEAEAVLAGA
jgi:hypothetical protein